MVEERVVFNSDGLRIEGLLGDLPGEKGVVVTHPHPLYGGDMQNHVVDAACRGYRGKGYSSLRFNFRGVGRSEGKYDEGNAEQADVEAAVDFLYHLMKREIDLVGYSFGAWVNAQGLQRLTKVKRVVMISPPVDVMDFSSTGPDPRINWVIAGTKDEFGDARKIQDAMKAWNPDAKLKIIQDADHFYGGKTAELQSEIEGYLTVS